MSKEEKKQDSDDSGSIAFDEQSNRFYVKGTNEILSGLHRVLTKKFYPVGSTMSNLKPRTFKTKSGKSFGGIRIRKPIRTERRAKNLGNRVDLHMQALVEAAKGDALTLRAWVDPDKTMVKFVKRKQKIAARPIKRIEPEALAAIRCLLNNNWVPIACQTPVGSAIHGIATKEDVYCQGMHEKSRFASVEVKTGYARTWDADTRQKFKAPLEEFWDSPDNKAHLQSATTGILRQASHGKLPEMFVLRLSQHAPLDLVPLKDGMRKRLKQIGTALVRRDEK